MLEHSGYVCVFGFVSFVVLKEMDNLTGGSAPVLQSDATVEGD